MASSSSATSTFHWTYDVFLSFRGEDTRMNFTDHLYHALKQNGIVTFRDAEGLERGMELSELLRAIEESRFSLVVLSTNYATSTWCLDELVKIVECIEKKQHTTFPIFYNVDPSIVRKQEGDFEKAFAKHEEENHQKVKKWRSALTQVAKISGWTSKGRHEFGLIQEIVTGILKRLNELFSIIDMNLAGINPCVKELTNEYLQVGLDDVRFIGICGMGGIGKTTLAKAVYQLLSKRFDVGCFLENVREEYQRKGLKPLQEKLIAKIYRGANSNTLDDHDRINSIRRRLKWTKFLLILDDVDQLEQLETLVGKHDWFYPGSRIIITTRNKDLLISHGVKENHIYKVTELDGHDALKLFHMNAFKQEKATKNHNELCKQILDYAKGLPLALKVLESSLCGKSIEEWKSFIGRLQKHPPRKIFEVLRISYDRLSKIDQQIFLDIACFFKGKEKCHVMKLLHYRFDQDVSIGIRELIDKSLLTVNSSEKIWMHDLIQEMGWKIVREQHLEEPGKWSRLWLDDDIRRVLRNENMGTPEVEVIILDNPAKVNIKMESNSFANMSKLKLLKINNVRSSHGHLEYISNELRFLEWPTYPFKTFPSNFSLENLYELDMCHSNIEHLWDGVKFLKKLKIVKLCHSRKLIRTPDFAKALNLEKLDLEGCINLVEVHKSVGLLQKLTILNLKDCKKLEKFPLNVCGLKSLKILNLHGCPNIEKLPQNLDEAELLEVLDLSGTAIRGLPNSIVQLGKLKELALHGCNRKPHQKSRDYFESFRMVFRRSQSSLCWHLSPLTGLSSLTKLDFSDCNLSDGAIPSDIGSLSSLEELNLSANNFVTLPKSIMQLSKLNTFYLGKCPMLKLLPQLPPRIALVGAENCPSLEILPSPLFEHCTSRKVELNLFNCPKLMENYGADMLLKHWLQDLSDQTSEFHIRLTRSEIPNFFTHWTNGSLIGIQLPPKKLNEIKGFAVCIVFEVPRYLIEKHPPGMVSSLSLSDKICYFKYTVPQSTSSSSSHLSLSYISRRLFAIPDSDIGNWVKARLDTPHNIVKKCGIHPIYYKQDDFEVIPERIPPMEEESSIPLLYWNRKIKHHQPRPVKRGDVKDRICSDVTSCLNCCLTCDCCL